MDWTSLAVAGMSLIGTLAGTLGGILVSNKLTLYRIEQLEKKVQAHNHLVERTYKLEGQITELEHDIRDLKNKMIRGGRHMEKFYQRLAALLSVKSIVTLVLTGVFSVMACRGTISRDFMTIYGVVIAFYFGTQSQKNRDGEAK